jgi:DNA primase
VTEPILEIVEPWVRRMKRSGSDNAVGLCPFHEDHSPSFSIHIYSGLWLCYACGLGGTLQKFLRLVGKSPAETDRILAPYRDSIESHLHTQEVQKKARFRNDQFQGIHVIDDAILGAFDFCPTYMTVRGFKPHILRAYDIGYDKQRDRVTFPIRDLYGNLVGISGRSVVGEAPRYKIYKRGHRGPEGWVPGDFGPNFDDEYPRYDIKKGSFLWNADQAIPLVLNSELPLIIVEGFKACLWLIQCGFPNTVALLTARMSMTQGDIIKTVGNDLILFLDNNQAGREGTRRVADELLETNLNTRVAAYPPYAWAEQPDDLSCKAIRSAVEGAERWSCLISSGF